MGEEFTGQLTKKVVGLGSGALGPGGRGVVESGCASGLEAKWVVVLPIHYQSTGFLKASFLSTRVSGNWLLATLARVGVRFLAGWRTKDDRSLLWKRDKI
jgi:hypothetical protein